MDGEEDQPQFSKEQNARGKPLVLVIDDNAQYGRLLELLSEKLGITAYRATSCEQGIAALKKTSFDVILMDWLMPEVDGPMCTALIREVEEQLGRSTPIIGVTGHIKVSHEKCLEAGMDDFLAIPFTIEQLHQKLSAWMRVRRD
jgi:CheY-like chemotaxis protein